jgi:hypothetical protein
MLTGDTGEDRFELRYEVGGELRSEKLPVGRVASESSGDANRDPPTLLAHAVVPYCRP